MPGETEPDRGNFDHSHQRGVQPLPPGVGPGSRVVVRGRSWTVDVREAHEDCDELRLSSLDDTRTLSVLWPFDRPQPERSAPEYRTVRPRAWLSHARAIADGDHPAVHLHSRRRGTGTLAVLPYQLVPALAMAAGAARVVLADEVGLGKTVQAGWIVDDLLARRPDARILVAVPAGLRQQWVRELARLFGIDANSVDARWLLRTANDLPAGLNVWTPPGVHVISLDYLKRPDISASTSGVVWDLLVVDEAHVAAAPTDRHKAVDAVARRSRATVLITATPFSGDEAGFSSLMAIGATGTSGEPLMFRRSREDVGDSRRRRHRFVRVRLSQSEQQLQRLLERYCREIWTHAPTPEARLAAIVLRKRALSSSAALARSLRRRQRFLAAGSVLPMQLTLFGTDTDEEDDEPAGILGTPGLADSPREGRWLARLVASADRAARSDSKLAYLKRLLRRTGAESVVVFTEFRDTLADVSREFPDGLSLHGGMSAAERDEVQARFNAEGGRLFATDAAAHGLNLHGRCRLVVSFELPWNPARLEQRIGRVDRIGQTRTVHTATLVARDTAEDFVIANIARRLGRVARTLGPKDRLVSFLNDARIAGIVIGGDPLPELDPATVRARIVVPDAVIAEASRLQRLLAWRRTPATGRNDVVVSRLRTPAGLSSGLVAAVLWTLRDRTGRVAAARTLFFHVPGVFPSGVAAAESNRAAADVVARYGPVLVQHARTEARTFRDAYRLQHQLAVQARVMRERRLLDGEPSDLSQPGLFDFHTLDDAVRKRREAMDARQETRSLAIRLEVMTTLEEHVDVKGVLFLRSSAT